MEGRRTKRAAGPAVISPNWVVLRADGEAQAGVAVRETLGLRFPSRADEPQSWRFGIDVDVTATIGNATLITTSGAPLDIEIPLNTRIEPTVIPTAVPTATPTRVSMETSTLEPTETPPPEPGTIRDGAAGGETSLPMGPGGAVEMILDTSGSMLQPIGAQLRIDVAKLVLTDVATQLLPAGAQNAGSAARIRE